MKLIFSALALVMTFSSTAFAEGQICDINGCRQASPSEDFWNDWYKDRYGYNYDQNYRRNGEYGYGHNRRGSNRNGGLRWLCFAKDYTGRVIAKSGSFNSYKKASKRALEACRSRSASPRTCKVDCRD